MSEYRLRPVTLANNSREEVERQFMDDKNELTEVIDKLAARIGYLEDRVESLL